MATKNHEQCLQEYRHAIVSLEYPNATNRVNEESEVNGRNPSSGQINQVALQNNNKSYFIYGNTSPQWIPMITGRNNAKVELTVGASSSVNGFIRVYFSEGMIYYLKMELESGTCNDADLELGDASFSGSPTLIYQIGTDSLGNPNWAPTTDGDWIDTNVFGFRGLGNGGDLYYRMTNNAVGSIGLKLTIYAMGIG